MSNVDMFLSQIEERFNNNQLNKFSMLLNRAYDVGLNDKMLWDELNIVFENKINDLCEVYEKKMVANEIINAIIMKYYKGERVIKYEFINKIRIHKRQITLFEMYVGSSRADICRINGESIVYEIKTEIDTLNRLSKQINDYYKVFEKVYVICSESHFDKVLTMIPNECGIITYSNKNSKYKFRYKKKAIKNNNLDSLMQLKSLSSKDVQGILKKLGIINIPSTKHKRISVIINNYNESIINKEFKEAIKRKYESKWKFINNNFNDIYPIDIQAFFKIPIDPHIAYFKNYDNYELSHSSIE